MSFATKAVPGSIRVFILREHALIRAGLRMLIENRTGLRVVGEAASYADARTAGYHRSRYRSSRFGPGPQSESRFLNEIVVSVKAAAADSHRNGRSGISLRYTVRLGAMGLVLKKRPADVWSGHRKIHAGEVWLDRSSIAGVLGDSRAATPGKLR
jgi:hypothetical protein